MIIFGNMEYSQRNSVLISQENYVKGTQKNVYFYLLVALFLFVGGFRYRVGTDYSAYYSGYTISWSELWGKFKALDEPLIYLTTNVCRYIWNEGIFVIFIEHAITFLLVFKGIRDWEDESWTMPLAMYILYCGWTSSFNGIRQSLAGAIVFAFSKKADRHWILKYAVVCFIAFLIHKTALFMLPILILGNRKIDFKQIAIILVTAIAMPYIGTIALEFIGGSLDNEYASHTVNSIRIIVSFVPVLFIAMTSEEFRKKNAFLVNMAMINALITFSTRNSALMYRFSEYTDIYLMLYIPKLSEMFSNNSKTVFKIGTIILFFLYFSMEIKSGNGNLGHFQWAFSHFGEH